MVTKKEKTEGRGKRNKMRTQILRNRGSYLLYYQAREKAKECEFKHWMYTTGARQPLYILLCAWKGRDNERRSIRHSQLDPS